MNRPRRVVVLALTAVLAAAAGCASPDDAGAPDPGHGPAGDEEETAMPEPRVPTEVGAPEEDGNGISFPQPAPAPPEGYVVEEILVGGTSTSFVAVEAPADGRWAAEPRDEAGYRTRIVVRRPERAPDFSGTVVVEWFNVSALEASPDWAYLADEIARQGHAYVGVSAQHQGVEGGDTLLDVDVDDDEAAGAGVSTDTSGLRNIDPERYGTLSHPGDAYAFDIFSQVGRLVRDAPEAVLGDLVPDRVLATGESQSAAFLTTLINAVHPLAPVFDGFLVHSRPAAVAPLDGDYARARGAATADGATTTAPPATLIRDDLEVPVMVFVTENDLTTLRYARARQPDTDLIRTWEVAGTAHADAHLLRAVVGGPRDPAIGEVIGCGVINAGPHAEVVSAAFHHLVGWAAGGEAPPTGPRIEVTDDGAIARDERGMALGGVRNPLVDVPVFVPTGERDSGTSLADGDTCALFGSTEPLDPGVLAELHGSADAYLDAFRTSADALVEAGFLLAPDAEDLVAEAEGYRDRF